MPFSFRPVNCTSDPGLGGDSTKFYTRRLRPEVQPLTLLYTIPDRKATLPPLVYVSSENDTLFTPVRKVHVCLLEIYLN